MHIENPRLLADPHDPWAVAPGAAPKPAATGASVRPRAVAAWLLGSLGPAIDLLTKRWWAGALAVLVIGLLWEGYLRRRPRQPVLAWAIAAVVVVAVPAATWSTIGRAPALLTLAGVLVADAALVGWAPIGGWPRRRVPVASLALLPLVGAQISWVRAGSQAIALVLLAASLVVVELYHRAPDALERADAALRRAVAATANAIGLVALGLVATVVLYLPGLLGRARDRWARRRPRSSHWHERTVPASAERRDADRPFASTEPRLAARRNLLGVAAVLVALALLGGVAQDRGLLGDDGASSPEGPARPTSGSTVTQPGEPDPEAVVVPTTDQLVLLDMARRVKLSALPAFADVPFIDDLQAEQLDLRTNNLVESDIGGRAVTDFEGRYTNVSDGERRTYAPPPCEGCPTATAWFIGGSAGFGFGQRDEHTVASELVRQAAADGVSLTVRNLSVPGLTIYEEAEKVQARLADGDAPPDLVVFYDGYNDVSGTLMASMVDGIDPETPSRLDFDQYTEVVGRNLDPNDVSTPTEMGELVATKYGRVQREASRTLGDRGIASVYAFQPDALASAWQYDAASPVWKLPEVLRSFTDEASDVAATTLEPEVLNLRHSLDDPDHPMFFDFSHTNERGARVVAERLWPQVRRELGLR